MLKSDKSLSNLIKNQTQKTKKNRIDSGKVRIRAVFLIMPVVGLEPLQKLNVSHKNGGF
jgi:hypothetical protein